MGGTAGRHRSPRVAGSALCACLVGCGGDGTAPVDAGVDSEVVGVLTNQGSTMMEDVRVEEGGIANFVTTTLLVVGSARTGETIDIAFMNAGGLRGGANSGPPDFEWSSETARIGNTYGPGPITRADVEGWFPFPNDTTIMTLSGAQIRRALEYGVSSFADDAGTTFGADLLLGDRGGQLLHAAGLSYIATCPGTTRMKVGPTDCDPTAGTCMYLNADEANTITRIAVGATVIYDAAAGGWQAGGDTAQFRVIMNSFIADAGDNHLDFLAGTARVDIPYAEWTFQQEMVERVRRLSPITLVDDEARLVVVGEVQGLPCNLPESCTPAHLAAHPNCAHLR